MTERKPFREKLKTMEITPDDLDQAISFRFNLSYPKVIDLVAFLLLLSQKFNGKLEDLHPFIRTTGKTFGHIKIRFPDVIQFHDAKTHCGQHLTNNGRVSAKSLSALDTVDPKRRISNEVIEKIKSTPITNQY